jgi:deoxyribonuclease-4
MMIGLIGAHISIAGGLDQAPSRGEEIGCTAIQIFTKNQVQWKARPLSSLEIVNYRQALANSSIQSVVAHNSYLINLASPEEKLLNKSRQAFVDEMDRAESLRIQSLIFHPGSYKNADENVGLRLIADSIDFVYQQRPDFRLKLLLETTAGQGTSLGYSFEQLKWIIDRIAHPDRVGVCLDTCHIFAAGYDIRSQLSYEKTFDRFDQVIGLEKLQAIHLNDSKKELGSRVDRHEHIGQGQIGLEAFRLIMNDLRFVNVPKLLETSGDLKKFKENLDLLKSLVEN